MGDPSANVIGRSKAVLGRKKLAIFFFPLWIAVVIALSDIRDPILHLVGKFVFNYLVLLLCTFGYFFFTLKKEETER